VVETRSSELLKFVRIVGAGQLYFVAVRTQESPKARCVLADLAEGLVQVVGCVLLLICGPGERELVTDDPKSEAYSAGIQELLIRG
jgi:hypothetical protein